MQSRPQRGTTPHVEAPNAHSGTPQVCEEGPNSDVGMREEGRKAECRRRVTGEA